MELLMKSEDFIDDFAQFLTLNYQKEFKDIVVIMNSGIECKLLQTSLIKLSPSSY